VLAELEKILSENPKLPEQSPFGDGKAAIRIVEIIISRLET
jgi:UDP-N-acetylglucosamine 2-epimerase (non-hydrolysing)